MKLEIQCAWRNLLNLLRFLVLYAGGVALLLYLMPIAAGFLQAQYESLSGMEKLSAVAVFSLLVTGGYLWSRVSRNA